MRVNFIDYQSLAVPTLLRIIVVSLAETTQFIYTIPGEQDPIEIRGID